jgi:hypothetical protein
MNSMKGTGCSTDATKTTGTDKADNSAVKQGGGSIGKQNNAMNSPMGQSKAPNETRGKNSSSPSQGERGCNVKPAGGGCGGGGGCK